jgi:hypothetical protein
MKKLGGICRTGQEIAQSLSRKLRLQCPVSTMNQEIGVEWRVREWAQLAFMSDDDSYSSMAATPLHTGDGIKRRARPVTPSQFLS